MSLTPIPNQQSQNTKDHNRSHKYTKQASSSPEWLEPPYVDTTRQLRAVAVRIVDDAAGKVEVSSQGLAVCPTQSAHQHQDN